MTNQTTSVTRTRAELPFRFRSLWLVLAIAGGLFFLFVSPDRAAAGSYTVTQLTVVKQAWQPNGVDPYPGPWSFDFTCSAVDIYNSPLFYCASTTFTLTDSAASRYVELYNVKTLTLTETVPVGWTASVRCVDGSSNVLATGTDSVTLNNTDGIVTCTFSNIAAPQTASLTITKATNPVGGTDFPFVLNPDDNSHFLAKGGSNGSGNSQFNAPYGVAVDGSGNIYVADASNHRIQKFNSAGTWQATWGGLGSGNGQFNFPIGVAVDGSGNVYVADAYNYRIQKFDAGGIYQSQWGSYGSSNGEFYYPVGVAVDGSGNVYVADSNNNRIQKFDGNGNYQSQWGSGGSSNGRFYNPVGVAVDGSGNVYVADTDNHRIQKFNSSGNWQATWGGYGSGNSQFQYPTGVAVDGSGNVYVADSGNNRIQKFDAGGIYQSQWGSNGAGNGQFNNPRGVAVDGSGNVYVADINNYRIQKFGPVSVTLDDGESHTFSDLPAGDHEVAELVPDGWTLDDIDCGNATATRDGDAISVTLVAGDDVTCVFSNSQLGSITVTKATNPAGGTDFPFVLDPDNSGFLAKWGSAGTGDGQFAYPVGVAVDGAGNVYVADTDNHRIQKFDSSGNWQATWGGPGSGNGQFNFPSGVVVDGSGNIYVADSGNFRIQKFDAGGIYQTQWGSFGSSSGQFSNPHGMAIDGSGNVYVADTGNHRIQKFTAGGIYQTQWGGLGSGDGQFSTPNGVAVDGSGNVYVADYGNRRIQKFTAAGIYQTQWGSFGSGNGQFNTAYDVAVDGSGNVYVADTLNNRIQMFDGNGAYLTQWGGFGNGNGQFFYPLGVAVDGSGNVYALDYGNQRIQKFGPRVVTLDDGESHTFTNLPADDYKVSELVPDGWTLDNIDCGNATATRDGDAISVTLAAGVDVTCTFSNSQLGSITVTKATNPVGGTDFPFVLDPDDNSHFLAQWGSNGSGNGQFDSPTGVAVDGNGNVYVAEYYNHRIQKFDAGGVYQTQWGDNGSGNGQFQYPIGVAVDGDGNVYVADSGNNRIQKFAGDGTFLMAFGWDVVSGNVDTDFEICQSGDTCKDGSSGSGDGQFNNPQGVAVDGAGNVYVADTSNNRIQKFDAGGAYVGQWGGGGSGDGLFNYPQAVAADGAGNVYVADSNNHRIQKFVAGGAYVTQWGGSGSGDGQFRYPQAVAADGAGNVYVADSDNSRIQKFGAGGVYQTQWGSFGSGSGQFQYPTGVAADGAGNVYVADFYDNRIQKFGPVSVTLDDGQSHTFPGLPAGVHEVAELVPDGWTLDNISCNGGSPVVTGDGVSVTLAAGDDVTCVFSNSETPTGGTITIEKVAQGGGNTLFEFDPSWSTQTITLTNGMTYTTPIPLPPLTPPATYSVSEVNMPFGWMQQSATCDNLATEFVVETISPESITMADGDAWVCTFTNVRIPAELIITPSYLVSMVIEGKASGANSMACYWITLPAAPTGNVVVDIAPGPEVTVNKTQVTLNAANWNNLATTNQTNFVCIRAVDDKVDEPENPQCGDKSAAMTSDATPYGKECGDHVDFIQHTLNTSLTTAPGYGPATPWTNNTLTPLPGRPQGNNYLDVMVTDNDVAGVRMTESFAVTDLDESGTPVGKSCYWVNLTTIPTGPVTVNITPGPLVSTDKASVTLNASNWNTIDPTFGNTGNFVCVTPKDDNVINTPVLPQPCFTGSATMLGAAGSGAQRCGTHLGFIGHGATSGDPKYNATGNIVANGANFDSNTKTIDVILRDDDVLLDRVVYEPATVNLLEGQQTTFGVRLSSKPAANVTVSSDLATLTFTPSNWKDLQPVTVSAAQNNTADGPLTSLYPPTVTSDDANFHNAAAPSVAVTVIDDDTAGVMLSSTTLSVSEAGQKATYQLSLTNKPTGNVTVSMASDGQLAFAPQSLTFTTQNWDKPQTVTVMAADDVVAEGAHTGRVTHQVSGGGGYADVVVSDIVVNVQDNDTAAVLVTDAAGLTVSEGGQPSAAYHLALQSRPTANVVVTVDGGGRLAAQPATVTFTPANWNVPQAVKLTAIDDQIDDGVISAVTLTHRAASADPFYEGYEPAWQQALVLDNDSAGLKLSQAMVSPLPGGGTATYTVALASKPRADVVVDLVAGGIVDASGPGCSGDDEGTSCLLFTPDNWNVPQTVTVSASGPGFITHRFESADAIYGRLGAYRVMVNQPFRLFTPMGSGSSK